MKKLAMLGLFATACGVPAKTHSSLDTQIPGSHNDYAQLGQAFSSAKSKILPVSCITSSAVDEKAGNTRGSFEIGVDVGVKDVLNKISGTLNADVKFPVIRAGVDAELAKEMAASEYVANRLVTYSLTPKKRVLRGPFSVSPRIANMLNDGGFDPANCGDEFITAVTFGAKLFVNMRVEFLNNEDKLNIGGNIELGYGMDGSPVGVDIQASANYLDEKTKKSVKITVRAEQHGGDPAKFAKVIPGNIMECNLDDPQPCIDMFNNVVSYAKEDFSAQLESLDNYNTISYETVSYEDALLNELAFDQSQLTKFRFDSLKEDLDERYQEAIEDEKRAGNILKSYRSWLDQDQLEGIKKIRDSAEDNADLLFAVAKGCYDTGEYEQCKAFYDDVKEKIESYDRELLSITRNEDTASRQCENARLVALENKLVSAADAKAFSNRNEAPVFVDNMMPSLGIAGWASCEKAAETYKGEFETLL